ncbi:MAG: alpha-galactosidase [Candidatus Omnitrophica bacterium]|nr:alpha-galactosidase [Candidatus Omnitrophota bacterium]
MAKITFIGAGSLGFTRGLVKDILTFSGLKDATFSLTDVNTERLGFSKQAVEKIIQLGQYPAKVEVTTDRKEALKGADAVIITILASPVSVWRGDIEIPKKYGVDTNIGDTRSASGVFRALRTIPVMLDICRDIERYCPQAIVLNYTNPMAMLCRAIQRMTSVRLVGLCHSVQGTAEMLARWLGADMKEITYLCAGINHQAWFIEYRWKGKDAYPLLREKILKTRKIYNEEIVRNEMFLHLDYYVTESSGHNSEYNWWFRKRPDLIKKYCTKGTGWNPGVYAYILKGYLAREKSWKQQYKEWLAKLDTSYLQRSHEFAAYIINAVLVGEPFVFNGNVANTGLITNLPEKACVEVPVLADRRGFNPLYVGPLPPQCAALNNINIYVEEMAVESALTGEPKLTFQAIAFDPLTASVLSLREIKKMVKEMFQWNQPYLPQFKKVDF